MYVAKMMNKITLSVCIAFALLSNPVFADEHLHWGYSGRDGPANWGALGEECATCKTGRLQAPIDIPLGLAIQNDFPIKPHYKSSSGEIVNNGHTIQVVLADGGSVNLLGQDYAIAQFHFHTPAEERVSGKRYPLNAHLVHKSTDGTIAVIGIFFKVGAENAVLKNIFLTMPPKEESIPLTEKFDIGSMLPRSLPYYKYAGSLTTPPCSEGVSFYILAIPLEISQAQLNAFQKIFPLNARPIKPVNGRMIVYSR